MDELDMVVLLRHMAKRLLDDNPPLEWASVCADQIATNIADTVINAQK